MRNLRPLFGAELRALYGINQIRYTKDPKEKNRARLLIGGWAVLALTVCFYVASLVWGLWTLGFSDAVPAYLITVASALIFVFGLFQTGHRLFSDKGYDLLSSMPLRAGEIVLSRFLALYGENLALSLAVMLPGCVCYAILVRPGIFFYLLAPLATLLLPAIPLAASALPGTLILAISSRMRHKNAVQTVLLLLFVIGILLLSLGGSPVLDSLSEEQITALFSSLEEIFARFYPMAVWVGLAITGRSFLEFVLFAILSLTALGFCVILAARLFHPVLRELSVTAARHDYKLKALSSRGLLRTLYIREAKRYFSSGIYVTNTIIGPILGAIFSGAILFGGIDAIASALPPVIPVRTLLPFALGGIFCMMTTTSCSLSMEGDRFWIVRSLPISAKSLLDAKILFNLTLILPFYLVAEVFLTLALRPAPAELLRQILIPALTVLLSVVLGITVNLKFPLLHWQKEAQVVKQSLSAALGGFFGPLLSLVCGGTVFLTPPAYTNFVCAALCVIFAAAAVWLYKLNNRARLENIE